MLYQLKLDKLYNNPLHLILTPKDLNIRMLRSMECIVLLENISIIMCIVFRL